MDSMTQWIALLACSAAAALAAGWLGRLHYGRRIADLNARIERADKARAHASELLLQARRQIEGLQKDLVMSRRSRPAAAPPPAPAAAPGAASKRPVLHDDHEDPQDTRIMPTHGFAETLPFEP